MVWFNDAGRMPVCEAGFSGFKQQIPVSFVHGTGFKLDPPIQTCFSTFSGYKLKR